MSTNASTAATAAFVGSPRRKSEQIPAVPCAIRYFWDFSLAAWKHCETHLEAFSAVSPRFTNDYVAGEVAFVNQVRVLPVLEVRNSQSSRVRLSLIAHRQQVLDLANLLDNAILYAYREQPPLVAVERKEAGIDGLRSATNADWAAVSAFITTGSTYLAASGGKLVEAGAIQPGFTAEFEAAGVAFNTVKQQLAAQRQSSKDGTKAVADGIRRILLELNPMLELGKQIFDRNPELRKLFTVESIVTGVRGGRPAGINGLIISAESGLPLSEVSVQVLEYPDKSAMSDKQGRYRFKQIAAGDYTLRFTSAATMPLQQKVNVLAGVSRRVNVSLETAPVSPSALATMVNTMNTETILVAQPQNGVAVAGEYV